MERFQSRQRGSFALWPGLPSPRCLMRGARRLCYWPGTTERTCGAGIKDRTRGAGCRETTTEGVGVLGVKMAA